MNKINVVQIAEECGALRLGTSVSGDAVYIIERKQLQAYTDRIASIRQEKDARLVDHILREGGGTYGDIIREAKS